MNTLYTFDQIAVFVLLFVAFTQTFLIRCFDPYKDRVKSGLNHHLHQLPVVGQIYRGFRIKIYPFFAFSPFNQRWQELCFEISLVAYEVVVYKKDLPTPSQVVKGIKLCKNLLGTLNARPVSKKGCYITKIATKGATPRKLDIH